MPKKRKALSWLNLSVIPPPAPFTHDVALRWLRHECEPLIYACRWGLMNADSSKTKGEFSIILDDGLSILQAAADVVAGRRPEFSVRLDVGEFDWPENTRTLVGAVCASLYDRPGSDDMEPPPGFNALAEILKARIDVEQLKEPERSEAAKRLAYPMAVAEPVGAGQAAG